MKKITTNSTQLGIWLLEGVHLSVFGISLKDNKEQQELARLIMENDKPIVIGLGMAGTGKTFVSIATALHLLNANYDSKNGNKRAGNNRNSGNYHKIVYTRNPVEVGKSIGFLKGGMDEKFGPYTAPLLDTLESIESASEYKVNKNDLMKKIEVVPLGFMRGRNFAPGTILIVDECQNLNLAALKTVMTRMSDYCKVVLLGSMNQIDEPEQRKKRKCDFQRVVEKFKDVQSPWVGIVNLTKSMRSAWCAEIDTLLGEIETESVTPSRSYNVTWGDGTHDGSFTSEEIYKDCVR